MDVDNFPGTIRFYQYTALIMGAMFQNTIPRNRKHEGVTYDCCISIKLETGFQ